MTAVPLTLLYVPGDRPERVAKALVAGSDVVIIDLEDAVAPAAKEDARHQTVRLLGHPPKVAVQIRINAAGSPWHDADIEAAASLPQEVGIRVPKCEAADVVRAIADRLAPHPVHVLVESALGVERAFRLATCHGDVATIGIGEADLAADLGVASTAGLLYARSRIVTAAAAAGLPAPTMSVFTDTRDLDALRASSVEGRALGFVGRSAIHPRQLPVIEEVFRPTPDETRMAQELLDAAEAAEHHQGAGAMALPDGRFVDAAVLRQARRVVEQARTRR